MIFPKCGKEGVESVYLHWDGVYSDINVASGKLQN